MRDSQETSGRGGHYDLVGSAPTDVRGYLGVVSRRKWIIVPFLLLMPLVAYVYSSRSTHVYGASAQVLLNRQSQALSGLDDPLVLQPERVIRTQADIARLPAIAQLVVDASGLKRDAQTFLEQSSVESNDQVDLLTFRVRDTVPSRAAKLANLYAKKYIRYRRQLDTRALEEASKAVSAQIAALEDKGLLVNSSLYSALSQRLQQLESGQVLQRSNALLVRTAGSADQIEPRPMKTAVLAFGAAIVLGLALAFLIDTLDTRVRDPEQLADVLGLPLLGSLPQHPRTLRSGGRIVMLDDPESPVAELFRMLRTSLDVTALTSGCRSIMVTSASAGEGKSTTAANLAVALARAGRYVVLVDLDLRRPSLDTFFDLSRRPGITDIVSGRSSIEDAGIRLTFGDLSQAAFGGDLRLMRREVEPSDTGHSGVLEVIGSGALPPNPGEFVVTSQLHATIETLRNRADLVIVDGPPLLLAGDALALASKVDAILLIARMNVLRRGQIGELERVLASSPALKLGLVATGHTAMPRRAYYASATRREELADHDRLRSVGGGTEDHTFGRRSQEPPSDLPRAAPGTPSSGSPRSWT